MDDEETSLGFVVSHQSRKRQNVAVQELSPSVYQSLLARFHVPGTWVLVPWDPCGAVQAAAITLGEHSVTYLGMSTGMPEAKFPFTIPMLGVKPPKGRKICSKIDGHATVVKTMAGAAVEAKADAGAAVEAKADAGAAVEAKADAGAAVKAKAKAGAGAAVKTSSGSKRRDRDNESGSGSKKRLRPEGGLPQKFKNKQANLEKRAK